MIIGASGAGKSTLLHILGALDRPDDGSVIFNEENIFKYNDDRLAKFRNMHVGFIFQFHHLLPEFTALENVAIPQMINGTSFNKATEKSEQLLKTVGLAERINHKPAELSGGEQQRVAVARALAGDPPFILADEPTGNLDSKSGKDVMEMLDNMNKDGKTIVLITHDNEVAEKSKRVITIRDGILTEKGMS